MNEKVQYWIDLSNEDITVAEILYTNGKLLYSGFMCHLAVEKGLKGLIQNEGIIPPKLHNLNRLAEIGNIINELSEEQINLLDMLNPLQIEARYPTYKQQIENTLTPDLCKQIIHQVKEFLKWIKSKL